jgi:copper chaperone CopZ
MKSAFILFFSAMLALAGQPALAQAPVGSKVAAKGASTGPEQVKILTSAVCSMCKARLEKVLTAEPGVQAATLDVPSKVLTVRFDPAKTSLATLRSVVQRTGYDADGLPADAKAYSLLPPCCQRDSDTH